MSDQITVRGISATGFHGVFDAERRDGQPFFVDVTIHLDVSAAAAEDDLDKTVDYGVLATTIAHEIEGEPVNLLETLAERIARRCLDHPLITEVEVTVHKPAAPMPVPVADVAVTVRRSAHP